ncbi:hypothetical protein B0T26DRAFT_728927 [Lasiosphaeria miniovina]|uniref:BTB domain-containing protein n=1 Tax=Lasiosphaeria miniovina TaxID=1954250 RepID=A0AA40DP68_9PEZI|nr:uncharacterized protein B0T26DRAFT_728927 [Lasiosphaeria miniovina]KAK0707043.1 hypothetical protein B0T26DRAFT_728927 [Lasiosphaeria miniovina]
MPSSSDGNTYNEAHQELAESLKRLYARGSYSDLEITCQGKSYPVHKAIVCPRSAFLAAACSGQFKEASDGRIDLSANDPKAVGAMISYLYCLDHLNSVEDPANSIQAPETCPELVAHTRVYILAEKYLIGGLKTLALRKFTTSVHDHFNVNSFL